jgi:peptide/nickel transport system substrate-binding protein
MLPIWAPVELGLQEVPTGSPWYGDKTGVFGATSDTAKAKQLLAGGLPERLSIRYLGLSQYPELLKTGRVVRDELKIGVNMTIKAVDVSVWYDAFVAETTRSRARTRSAPSIPITSTRWLSSQVVRSTRPDTQPGGRRLIDKAAASGDNRSGQPSAPRSGTKMTSRCP